MPSDESIRNDASTAKPGSGASLPEPVSDPNISRENGDSSENVDQAKTVIRGSSRIDRAPNGLQQSPAVVTKVLLGQNLNQYFLEDLIGGGGMGAVFRAHDQQLDRTVAVKVIPFVGDDPDLQRRFRNEAQSAAKLDDPRIARVYDAGNHDEWHYIVFEYIEGTNIRDQVVANGVFSIDDAVYYTSQLAGAIQHASDRGIVHRDIKPSNVIVGSEGMLKLVDMGLARREHLEMSEDMTASGVTLGTFDYISPEQARDPRNADLRSDIYSLGCTLYFMLTGNPPYPGGTMAQKIISHGTAPPPNVHNLRPSVSDHLAAVLNKMLAKAPSNRYANANDLLADLREVARRDDLSKTYKLAPLPIPQPAPDSIWFQQYSPWIAGFVLLLLSAGWLRLESASMRDDVAVPASAVAPQRVSVSEQAAQDPSSPASTAPTDSQNQTPAALAPVDLGTGSGDQFSDTDTGNRLPTIIRLVEPAEKLDRSRDEQGAALADSFPEAVALAREYGVGQIEITVPVVYSEPIRIETAKPLIIRSTVGGSLIVFQTTNEPDVSTTAFVSIDSKRIEFEDLHFVWSRPENQEEADQEEADREDNRAIFDVHSNHQIRLTRCSVTVRDSGQSEHVFGFRVSNDSSWHSGEEDFPVDAGARQTQIELRSCIIRGGLTMLAFDGNSNLRLTWDNGLLAISGRMIDATGTRFRQVLGRQASIELALTRLTAHVPLGFLRIQTSPEARHPFLVDRQSSNSLFVVDSKTPHIEFSGLASRIHLPELLHMRGGSNWYVSNSRRTNPMLKIESENKQGIVTSEVTLVSQIQTDRPLWFADLTPQWAGSPWSDSELGAIKLADRTAEDYQQDHASEFGFDLESLPEIPTVTAARDKLSNGDNQQKEGKITDGVERDLTFPPWLDLIGVPPDLNGRP